MLQPLCGLWQKMNNFSHANHSIQHPSYGFSRRYSMLHYSIWIPDLNFMGCGSEQTGNRRDLSLEWRSYHLLEACCWTLSWGLVGQYAILHPFWIAKRTLKRVTPPWLENHLRPIAQEANWIEKLAEKAREKMLSDISKQRWIATLCGEEYSSIRTF